MFAGRPAFDPEGAEPRVREPGAAQAFGHSVLPHGQVTHHANGVAVFVRSVYLQGLLAMPESDVPPRLQGLVPTRRRLESLAREAGLALTELAVRGMLGQEGVTCVLAGVETRDQLLDNIALFNRGPLPADLLAAVDAAVPTLPEAWLTPSMWPEWR